MPKKRSITLRMLLSHTGKSRSLLHCSSLLISTAAGFAYSFFNSKLNDFVQPVGLDEFSGNYHDTVSQPLINQPGDAWEYGINLDW